jgi:glutamine synthetase
VSISLISHTVNLINTDKVIQTGIYGINLPISGDLPTYLLPYLFGKIELHPDWNSLGICEYAEGNTMVICYLNETHPTAPHKYTMGFEHDPHTTQQIPIAARRISNSNPQRWHRHMQFHAEFGPAQFEVTTGPLPPIEAIEALICSQEALRSIAFKHDAYATFHPKPLLHSEQRNSLRVHISVESSDKEFVPDKFLARLLKHLRAMCLFIMPNNDSYKQAGDFFLDKAVSACWDTENRATPLR